MAKHRLRIRDTPLDLAGCNLLQIGQQQSGPRASSSRCDLIRSDHYLFIRLLGDHADKQFGFRHAGVRSKVVHLRRVALTLCKI
jgi:hypothetical protein